MVRHRFGRTNKMEVRSFTTFLAFSPILNRFQLKNIWCRVLHDYLISMYVPTSCSHPPPTFEFDLMLIDTTLSKFGHLLHDIRLKRCWKFACLKTRPQPDDGQQTISSSKLNNFFFDPFKGGGLSLLGEPINLGGSRLIRFDLVWGPRSTHA